MKPVRSRLAERRRASGYTQEELAEALHVDRSTVHRWESGRSEPQPYVRPKLAKLLGLSRQELESLLRAAKTRSVVRIALAGHAIRESADLRRPSPLAGLRQVVVGRDQIADLPDSHALGEAVNEAHRLYQHAEYDATAKLLPMLIAQLDNQPSGHSAAARRAGGYVAAAKLATKLGDANLAWITADRAHAAALESGQAALVGVASYQVACALLRNGHLGDAQNLVAQAADDLAQHNVSAVQPLCLSARGALLLLSAVAAARIGDVANAASLLRQARALADVLGHDGNYLWTGFGPTNVAIHELSVAVQLGDTRQAYALGAAIDTECLPDVLVGRRSQVHLDLGRAAKDMHEDGLAVLHLLEAERVAKQAVSRNTNAHEVIRALLGRERRNTTPGLRALADRAGVRA